MTESQGGTAHPENWGTGEILRLGDDERRYVVLSGETQEFRGYSVEEILTLMRGLKEMSDTADSVRYQPGD
jgi:hypothetical protein